MKTDDTVADGIKKTGGIIGLAQKAGKLIIGTERLTESIRKNASSVKIALTASNASANTYKRVENCCSYYGVQHMSLELTSNELAHAIGKSGAVSAVGITDNSFTAAVKNILCNKANKL